MAQISEKWKQIASGWLGDESGRHCHWCKHMVSEDGCVTCGNKASPFCDGDRIRTWDGLDCASKCPVWELNEWYTDDANYDSTFNTANTQRDRREAYGQRDGSEGAINET